MYVLYWHPALPGVFLIKVNQLNLKFETPLKHFFGSIYLECDRISKQTNRGYYFIYINKTVILLDFCCKSKSLKKTKFVHFFVSIGGFSKGQNLWIYFSDYIFSLRTVYREHELYRFTLLAIHYINKLYRYTRYVKVILKIWCS